MKFPHYAFIPVFYFIFEKSGMFALKIIMLCFLAICIHSYNVHSELHGFRIHSLHVVVCQYQWSCTAPDENGEQYIPTDRDWMNGDALTALTASGVVHIYRVPNLGTSCYGHVTAIDYCYRYNAAAVTGQVILFNWIVLILKDAGNNFVISSIYVIQSNGSVGGASCTVNNGRQVTCCDRTNINGFDLPQNFIFGVTESAQGNAAGAILLGFHDSLPKYQVDVVLLNKAEVTLSVGSIIAIHSSQTTKRGIRMLWFVIGEFNLACCLYLK